MASRPPEITPPTALERQRFFVLNMVRIAGFALILFGILLSQAAVDLAGEHNALIGYVFIAVGFVDGFFMPRMLARKWRTPDA